MRTLWLVGRPLLNIVFVVAVTLALWVLLLRVSDCLLYTSDAADE